MKCSTMIILFAFASLMMVSCKKTIDVVDADYLPQQVYLPAANPSNAPAGVYLVNTVAQPGQTFLYKVDLPGSKFIVPLSVYRSGVTRKGSVAAELSINTDTVAKLLLVPGKFPAETELLPADKFTLSPAVTIADGADIAIFSLNVDLEFLKANLAKKFATAVRLSSSQAGVSSLNHAVILIDPAFLVPAANFSATATGNVLNFSNTSANAVSYSWDYGDGTSVSLLKDAPHTYSTAGSYTVTLTAYGALGEQNKSVKTMTVVIN